MTARELPEVWLRGPVPGIVPQLLPAAHAFLQVVEEVERVTGPLTEAQLWLQPGGAASIGFHLKHLVGSIDRLLTYARGEKLSETQRALLGNENETGTPLATTAELMSQLRQAVQNALVQLKQTQVSSLHDAREVGRGRLPSTVLGLLFHAAEHAQRHSGQITTTAKVIQDLRLPR